MRLLDTVVVVTGGAQGIGRAMAERFVREGARQVVIADQSDSVINVARDIGAHPFVGDVSVEADVQRLVADTVASHDRIDLFCSNAGIAIGGSLEKTTDAEWHRIWDVNVMAHVYAARAVVPSMLAAGRGYLLNTASAAGLLSQIGGAPYAVTKHAAVAFAEWLAITYGGDRGITVSCLCPQGVKTPMLQNAGVRSAALLGDSALDPDVVADAVVEGLATEQFLILPHPEVAEYFRRKGTDYDRWLRGMRRLQAQLPAD
jgi:NAD(P)-dependent dehydrogenase (short-subunit alcohol dehydrogenase family)